MTLRTLNYGKYGIFLIMGNAGFISSTAVIPVFGLGEELGEGDEKSQQKGSRGAASPKT